MFVSSTGFKRIIKEAYKGPGLLMGSNEEAVILGGSYWILWIRQGEIPKKELGAIIELTGEIPCPGQAFIATKNGNQYKMMESVYFQIMEQSESATWYLEDTGISYTVPGYVGRVLQEPESRKISLIQEAFYKIIDAKAVEEDKGEWGPGKPKRVPSPFNQDGSGAFWSNNIMGLYIEQLRYKGETEERILSHLEMIQLF